MIAYRTGMKISREAPQENNRYVVRAYGPGEVQINETRYSRSLIVAPDQLLEDWPVSRASELTPAALEPLLALDPEIILLGTGEKLQMLGMEFQLAALENGSGLEVMDTAAACRTFNVLMGEGRKVVAGLVLEG
ncbi:MAG: Mth938-like domain-containing protein [Gammaproteobacteria bacterium]|nr:Mth938-like domain-containing protein [Gammaproteobacteria bacterium]